MGYRTISQVAMISAALFLVFAVIKPKLDSIKIIEDQSAQYQDAVEKATEYNRGLAALVSTKDSFTRDELERLERYLPSSVDSISVMADIKSFADTAGLDVVSISVATSDSDSSDENTDEYLYDEENILEKPKTSHEDFTLNAQGYYTGIKMLLATLEYNQYPLEVVSLNFSEEDKSSEGTEGTSVTTEPVFTYTLVLRAYSFTN